MLKLIVFDIALLIIIAAMLFVVKKTAKTQRARNIWLLCAATVTILVHYSEQIYRCITGSGALDYLKENPNLILPIYPCNAVMWSCLILGLMTCKESKAGKLITDYIFWFGIVSTLVGMFANMDFIANPTLLNYANLKSIIAHATLLFNVLLLPMFGMIRLDFIRNMTHIFFSVVGMYLIGLYCNLVYTVMISAEEAYEVNSMFIIHSPFEGLDFLRYPVIAGIGLVLYCIMFFVCELIAHKKGERFYDRLLQKKCK